MSRRGMICRTSARCAGLVAIGLALMSAGAAALAGEDAPEATVTLSFAQAVRLVDLVEYVSARTESRFIYDETLAGEVFVRSPVQVRVAHLVPLLRSILGFKGYQVTEEAGWHTIRRGGRAEVARQEAPSAIFLSSDPPDELRPDAVYSMVLELRHVAPEEFAGAVTGLAGVAPVRVQQGRGLAITDYGRRIAAVLEVAELLDAPSAPLMVVSYTFQHVQAPQVKDMAIGLLRTRILPELADAGAGVRGPALLLDQAANRVILLVPPERAEECLGLLASVDVGGEAAVRVHPLRGVDAEQGIRAVTQALRARAPGLKEVSVERVAPDRLLVVGPPSVQDVVANALSILQAGGGLNVRYYVVAHVPATRILSLAGALLGVGGPTGQTAEMLMVAAEENTLIARLSEDKHSRLQDIIERFDTPQQAVRSTRTQFYQIRNTSAPELARRLRLVLGVTQGEGAGFGPEALESVVARSQYLGVKPLPAHLAASPPDARASAAVRPEATQDQPRAATDQELIRIVADENTNAIVVRAPVDYHETVGTLIDYLDRRRPQVLIEATIASVSLDSDLAIAVELLHNAETGTFNALVFSSFGLSAVDLATGTLTLRPGSGFNASIVDPDGTSAIIRALRSDSKSRVLAEPRLLVNDNAEGRFESVQEEPFTSINVGDTVSTTSFAGYAEAGLTIVVTPRISEGNFVVLDYQITSRDFGETSAGPGVPPARTSDVIASSVTVPDGHTAVVGGLSRNRSSLVENRVPILGRIPLLGVLFRSRTKGASGSRLFVFLRPVVLRDEDFADLKGISGADLMESTAPASGLDAIYPPVEPRIMR